jgi:hypothetical protein
MSFFSEDIWSERMLLLVALGLSVGLAEGDSVGDTEDLRGFVIFERAGLAGLVGAEAAGFAGLVGAENTGFAGLVGAEAAGFAGLVGAENTGFAELVGAEAVGFAGLVGADAAGLAGLVGAENTGFAGLVGDEAAGFAGLVGAEAVGITDFVGVDVAFGTGFTPVAGGFICLTEGTCPGFDFALAADPTMGSADSANPGNAQSATRTAARNNHRLPAALPFLVIESIMMWSFPRESMSVSGSGSYQFAARKSSNNTI